MRTANQQKALDPNDLLYYAPRRLRERIDDAPALQPHGDNYPSMRLRPAANDRSGYRPFVESNSDYPLVETPLPESLRRLSEVESESSHSISRVRWTPQRRLALAVAATVVTVASFVVELVILDAIQWQDSTKVALNPLSENRPAPTLVVADGGGTISMPLLLGNYETSTGAALSAAQWPTPDAGRGKAARLQTPTENAVATTGAKRLGTVRQINPSEVTSLLKRAEALVSTGDLPAARLLLNRLAEAHNARAAFDLAATYDPTVIKALGAVSASPDLALARTWYERARDWGSTNASEKLHALANATR